VTAEVATADPRDLPSPARRAIALVSFAGRSVRSGWAWRASALYAWAAALGYVALAGAWSVRGESVAEAQLVARARVWISWAGGTAAWVAARNVEVEETRLGLTGLAALRGASPRAYLVARVAATMMLVARVVGLPAVAAAVCVAALGGISAVRVGPSVVGATLMYALIFGVVFGGAARLASSVSPRHGRVVFVALVLGPEVLRGAIGDVPGLVSGFAELIDLLFGVGSASA
jgi:hypothetical protein